MKMKDYQTTNFQLQLLVVLRELQQGQKFTGVINDLKISVQSFRCLLDLASEKDMDLIRNGQLDDLYIVMLNKH